MDDEKAKKPIKKYNKLTDTSYKHPKNWHIAPKKGLENRGLRKFKNIAREVLAARNKEEVRAYIEKKNIKPEQVIDAASAKSMREYGKPLTDQTREIMTKLLKENTEDLVKMALDKILSKESHVHFTEKKQYVNVLELLRSIYIPPLKPQDQPIDLSGCSSPSDTSSQLAQKISEFMRIGRISPSQGRGYIDALQAKNVVVASDIINKFEKDLTPEELAELQGVIDKKPNED